MGNGLLIMADGSRQHRIPLEIISKGGGGGGGGATASTTTTSERSAGSATSSSASDKQQQQQLDISRWRPADVFEDIAGLARAHPKIFSQESSLSVIGK